MLRVVGLRGVRARAESRRSAACTLGSAQIYVLANIKRMHRGASSSSSAYEGCQAGRGWLQCRRQLFGEIGVFEQARGASPREASAALACARLRFGLTTPQGVGARCGHTWWSLRLRHLEGSPGAGTATRRAHCLVKVERTEMRRCSREPNLHSVAAKRLCSVDEYQASRGELLRSMSSPGCSPYPQRAALRCHMGPAGTGFALHKRKTANDCDGYQMLSCCQKGSFADVLEAGPVTAACRQDTPAVSPDEP